MLYCIVVCNAVVCVCVCWWRQKGFDIFLEGVKIVFAEGYPSEPDSLRRVSLSSARFVMILGVFYHSAVCITPQCMHAPRPKQIALVHGRWNGCINALID